MSKWRPTEKNAIYVIPDIHGMYDSLCVILERILPLRKSDGGQDKLIFLGDYVDRRKDSHKVLDKLIELKKEYGNQIITLMGNHEIMMKDAYQFYCAGDNYDFWVMNGGLQTLVGYIDRIDYKQKDPIRLAKSEIRALIPHEHYEFISGLQHYYKYEDYVFVHAAIDVNLVDTPQFKEDQSLFWDFGLSSTMRHFLYNSKVDISKNWPKTLVCGHSGLDKRLLIGEKYFMLDASGQKRLTVMELRSKEIYYVQLGNKKMTKYDNTVY